MTKDEKIKAIREGVRDLGTKNEEKNYDKEVLLVNTRLRDFDEFVIVAIDDIDVLVAQGVSVVDEEDWTTPVDELSDSDIDSLYDGLVNYEKWVEKTETNLEEVE